MSGLLLDPQAGGGAGGAAPAPVLGAPPPVADPPRTRTTGIDLKWLFLPILAALIGLGAQLERRRR